MKYAIKLLSTSVFVAMLLAMAGCASTATSSSTGEYIDDTVITTKVKAAIFNEEGLSSREISVETFKGVVQLSGFVSSQSDIGTAIRLAQGVNGVQSVVNSMVVR